MGLLSYSLFLGNAVSRCNGGACGSVFSECVGVGGPASRCGVPDRLPESHTGDVAPLFAGIVTGGGAATIRGKAAASNEPLCNKKHTLSTFAVYLSKEFLYNYLISA